MSKPQYINNFIYKGKTIKEWKELLDKSTTDTWGDIMANITYGTVDAELEFEELNK